MKRWMVALLTVFAVATICITPVLAASKVSNLTVVDYFLLLPPKHFAIADKTQKKRMLQARASIVDIKNDYILVPGGDAQATLNVVVFRHNGKAIVAVLDGGYDPYVPTLEFLSYQNGQWRDVSKEILPQRAQFYQPRDAPDGSNWYHATFRLPRYGTTIGIFDSGGAKLFDLLWRSGKFVLKNSA